MRTASWWPTRRGLLLDAAVAVLVLAGELSDAVLGSPGDDGERAARSLPVVAVVVAVAVLLRRRFPLPLLALVLLDGILREDVSFGMPFAAYAVLPC